jgi:hypothetical protein
VRQFLQAVERHLEAERVLACDQAIDKFS